MERRRIRTYLLGCIVLIDLLNSDYERQRQSDAGFSEQVIDSTPPGFGVGIDNISDLNSQPRPCYGFQDVDTVLEFVFWVRHYQVDLDVRLDKYDSKVNGLATLQILQVPFYFKFL